jgi:hypothetical protein
MSDPWQEELDKIRRKEARDNPRPKPSEPTIEERLDEIARMLTILLRKQSESYNLFPLFCLFIGFVFGAAIEIFK